MTFVRILDISPLVISSSRESVPLNVTSMDRFVAALRIAVTIGLT